MRKVVLALSVFVTFAVGSVASAQGPADLKVIKIEIVPTTALDKDPIFSGHPVIEAAPVPNPGGAQLKLSIQRSYRFIVTVGIVGTAKPPIPCIVRTECVRAGKKNQTLGQASIVLLAEQRGSPYACYSVLPSAAGGPGDCVIRTVIVDHAGKEFNALEFKATIVK